MYCRLLGSPKRDKNGLIERCPICESKHIGINHFKTLGFTTHYAIICNKCGYKEAYRSKRKAIKEWNNRHIKVFEIKF